MNPDTFADLLDSAMGESLLKQRTPRKDRSNAPHLRASTPDPWEAASRMFDVRAMNCAALAELSLDLYEAGAITTLDHLILSASPEDTELPWGSPLLTGEDPDAPLDWIEEFKTRRQQAWSFRHHKSVEELDRLIAHLTRIDALARGWRAHTV